MHSIFISYRRADSGGYAGRLDERLAAAFGREHVFIDIDSISYGEDFVDSINRTLQECEIVLVLIGPHWLTATDGTGARRLDSPTDTVVLEITSALEMQRKVLPVLIGDASMPAPEALPASIRHLARRNAIEISDRRFNKDTQELIETLRGLLARSRTAGVPAPPAPARAAPVSPPAPSPQSASRSEIRRPGWLGDWRKTTALAAVIVGVIATWLLFGLPSSRSERPSTERQAVDAEPLPDTAASAAGGQSARSNPGAAASGAESVTVAADAAAAAAYGASMAAATSPSGRPTSPASRPLVPNISNLGAILSNPWLNSVLYGNDNPIAALKKVTIRAGGGGYRINVSNQFNFECGLDFDAAGNPARLSNCASKDPPTPMCGQSDPHSVCVEQSKGCFHVTYEARPDCFSVWTVKEPQVLLTCSSRKGEEICSGKYTLVSGTFSDAGEFKIARRLP